LLAASNRDAAALWSAALDALAGRVAPRTRASLGANTAPLELLPGSLRVAVRAAELPAWISSGALALLCRSVERLTDGMQALAFAPVPDGSELARDPLRELGSFIATPTTAAARDRIRALVHAPGPSSRCVLLHGARGSGKTHLLRCAASALDDRFPGAVRFLSAGELVLQLVDALWRREIDAFRTTLRTARALVIDDLEALEAREATQEELALAIDAALGAATPVLLASTRTPLALVDILPGLASPLAASESFELAAPAWEARVAIVLDRVRSWGLDVAPAVASELAAHLRTELEPLDAVLTRLIAESGAGLQDAASVQRILQAGAKSQERPAPERVLELVARHFGVRTRDLRSRSRAAHSSTPRQVAIYLLRRHCGLSYPEVGRQLRRHHTTALHADRLVQRQLQSDAGLRSAIVVLEKELRSRPGRGR
jgi:chromosomal replication initiator protein